MEVEKISCYYNDVDVILKMIINNIKKYGILSIADYYDLIRDYTSGMVDILTNYEDNLYGWTESDIENIEVDEDKKCCFIKFPLVSKLNH